MTLQLEILTWILTGLSITGVILNAQMKISGFYFWVFANIGWIYVGCRTEMYAQVALFTFYTGCSIYGIYMWRKKRSSK